MDAIFTEASIFRDIRLRKAEAAICSEQLNSLYSEYSEIAQRIADLDSQILMDFRPDQAQSQIDLRQRQIELFKGQIAIRDKIVRLRERFFDQVCLNNCINAITHKYGADRVIELNQARVKAGLSPLFSQTIVPAIRNVGEMLNDLKNALQSDNIPLFHHLLFELAQYKSYANSNESLYDLLIHHLGKDNKEIINFLNPSNPHRDRSKSLIINSIQLILERYYRAN